MLKAQMLSSRQKSQPQGPNPSLKAQIPATKPKSLPNSSPMAYVSAQGSNPSCKKEKFPNVWKHSSWAPPGPLPCSLPQLQSQLRQGTGTADHLTLLRLLLYGLITASACISFQPPQPCPYQLLRTLLILMLLNFYLSAQFLRANAQTKGEPWEWSVTLNLTKHV